MGEVTGSHCEVFRPAPVKEGTVVMVVAPLSLRSLRHTPEAGTEPQVNLATHRLFAVLPPSVFDSIAPCIVRRAYPRGASIFRAHEPVKDVFVIDTGLVSITEVDPRGNVFAGLVYGSGDLLGMAPAIFGIEQDVSATALVESTLHHEDHALFRELYERFPRFAQQVAYEYYMKLRRLERSLAGWRISVPSRVAVFLLESATERDPLLACPCFDLQLSYERLALLLGTTRETVNRVLSRLARAGVIAIHGRHMCLLKPETLHELAASELGMKTSLGPPAL